MQQQKEQEVTGPLSCWMQAQCTWQATPQ